MSKHKLLKMIQNTSGGIDLLTERDAGNEVRILTGKKERSLAFWIQLRTLSEAALIELGCSESKEMGGVCGLKDDTSFDPKNIQVVFVDGNSRRIEIRPVGYGDCTSKDGYGCPILLEKYDGKLQLHVWADINSEDTTHKIDLSGALETARKPDPNECPKCHQSFANHNGDGSCVKD